MIFGKVEQLKEYAAILPHLENALEVLKKAEELPLGRTDFSGGYLLLQEGTTKSFDEGTYESHRQWIDVQILLEGEEEIAWDTLDQLTCVLPYDTASDKARYQGTHKHTLLMEKGMFWIAFPSDGHQAVSHSKQQYHYRRI